MMQVDMPIGSTCVTLVYNQHRESDVYEVWGAVCYESGCVTDLVRVMYKGKPISLNQKWEERAVNYLTTIGE